jgi:NAD(P)H-hydrate epimerase
MNVAVRADETVTFGHCKHGLLLYPGTEYTGRVTITDIGFPEEATIQAKPDTFYYEKTDLNRLPARKNYSNKGTYGKVLIIAGSKGAAGAAIFSARAAYRSGAGLVKILSSEHNRIILQSQVPEALFSSYDEEGLDADEKQQKLLTDLAWATVIAIGPGLGMGNTAAELLETVIRKTKVPILLDADAINLLAKKLDHQALEGKCAGLQERLHRLSELLPQGTILTPHLLELSRLIGIPVADITHNLIDTVLQCSYNNNLIYVAKDARTIVSGRENRYINISGNPGMATGGSGDVLTGMIAAFIAQGMEPFGAACLGVYVHGLSGDEAAKTKGTYSMMAGDIVDSIEKVLMSIEKYRSDFQI